MMESIITYIKVCLLLYYLVVNAALRAMPICNMYHNAGLVGMVVLTLNFILWLKGVVFCKSTINNMIPMGKLSLHFLIAHPTIMLHAHVEHTAQFSCRNPSKNHIPIPVAMKTRVILECDL